MLIQALINRGCVTVFKLEPLAFGLTGRDELSKSDSHYREGMGGGGVNEERFDWHLFISIVMENVILLIRPLKDIKA